MNDKSLPDLFSQLIPDEIENKLGLGEESSDAQNNILVEGLIAVAGLSGAPLEGAVNEFLNGEGALHETTRSALTRGGSSAVSEVAAMLTSTFKLSPVVANLVATLVVKLFPSISKGKAKESAAKKKPRRKTKPTAQTEAASKKKTKKKTPATPKAAAKKPATKKKKTTSQSGEKKSTTSSKPKKATRTTTLEDQV